MTKVIQAILSGFLATLVYDYFFFIGLHLHYIQKLEIDVYFNPFFVDNQNILLFGLGVALYGVLIVYVQSKVKYMFLMLSLLISFLPLIPSLGYSIGEKIFMQKNVTLHNKKFTFIGDIYYIGRDKITFYDNELKKVIQLDKNEIKEKL